MRRPYKHLSDEELAQKIKEEKYHLMSGSAKERIISRRVLQEIDLERTFRFEEKHGLK